MMHGQKNIKTTNIGPDYTMSSIKFEFYRRHRVIRP